MKVELGPEEYLNFRNVWVVVDGTHGKYYAGCLTCGSDGWRHVASDTLRDQNALDRAAFREQIERLLIPLNVAERLKS